MANVKKIGRCPEVHHRRPYWKESRIWHRAKIASMKLIIAAVVMLALGLQGLLVAFAATSPLMSPDCQTSAISHAVGFDSCCPSGFHSSCCLDECLASPAITESSVSPIRNDGPAVQAQFSTIIFSSRGDSPLIRPPIL